MMFLCLVPALILPFGSSHVPLRSPIEEISDFRLVNF